MIIASPLRAGAVLAALALAMLSGDALAGKRHAPIDQGSLGSGERIEGVEPNSAAARAGLRPGDVIVAIDGRPIGNFFDIAPAVTGGGRRVTLTVRRNGALVRVMARPRAGVLGVSKLVPGIGITFGHSDETFIPSPPIPPTPPEPPVPIQVN